MCRYNALVSLICFALLPPKIYGDTIFSIGTPWVDEPKDIVLDTSTGDFYVALATGDASSFSKPLLLKFDSSCNLKKYEVIIRNYHLIPQKFLFFKRDYILLAGVKYFPSSGYEFVLFRFDSSLTIMDSAFVSINGVPIKTLLTHYQSKVVVVLTSINLYDTNASWIVFDTSGLSFMYLAAFPSALPKFPSAIHKETDTTYLIGFSGPNLSLARIYKENTIISFNIIPMGANYYITSLYRDAAYGVLVGGLSSHLSDTLGGFLSLITDNLASLSAIEYWAYKPRGSAINDIFIYNGQAYSFGFTTSFGFTPSKDAYLVSYSLPSLSWNSTYSSTFGTNKDDYLLRAVPFKDSVIILGATWGDPSNDIPDALLAKLPLSALNFPLIYKPKNHYTIFIPPIGVEILHTNADSKKINTLTITIDGKILPSFFGSSLYIIRKRSFSGATILIAP